MQFVTDFGDQAVMLPLAAVIGLFLAASRWWRGLAAWVVAVVAVLGTLAVGKYVFFACTSVLGGTGIQSPSGHTASTSMIVGGGLVLFGRGRLPGPVLAAFPVGVAVLIGASRVAVQAHTVPEVLAGGAVGLAGVVLMTWLAGPRPPLRGWPVAVASIAILAGLHGVRLHAEAMLHSAGLFGWLPLPDVCHG